MGWGGSIDKGGRVELRYIEFLLVEVGDLLYVSRWIIWGKRGIKNDYFIIGLSNWVIDDIIYWYE